MILSRKILERFIEEWKKWKVIQAQNILDGKGHTIISIWPLVFSPKLETSDEKQERGNTDGGGLSSTKAEEEELANLKGGKDSP